MVKGVTRQVILMDSPDKTCFEKAIFILKDGGAGLSEDELLREARALAAGSALSSGRIGSRIPRFLWALAGAGLVGAAWVAVGILA